MKKRLHSLLLALCGVLLVGGASGMLHAQNCRSEIEQTPWPVPPAIAGQNGDEETAGPAIFFVGERSSGNIQVWEISGSLSQTGTLRPGVELPADVKGIWSLAIPKPDLIIGLATYDDGGTERYGILRSEDLGETWQLLKPDAFKDPQFVSLEGVRGGGSNVDFTGNYWRAALLEMTWLKGNGDYGWVWGRKGILRTTDAGLTWEIAYKETGSQNDQSHAANPGVWRVAFADPMNGVAIIGPMVAGAYYKTTDGGANWTQTKSLEGYLPGALNYITGEEYRSITANPHTAEARNAFSQVSRNGGANWTTLHQTAATGISPSRTVPMVEWFWPNPNVGFLVYRRGEIRKSTDGGGTWSALHAEDDSYPEVLFGPGRDEPLAGYGQRSIMIYDGFGDPYIAQAITFDCTGEVGHVAAWGDLGVFTSVPSEATPLAGFSTFPNPASERVDVRFSLDEPRIARAVLFDSRGTAVRNLNFGVLEAGDYIKNVDLRDLPSGSYRLVVRAGEQRSVEAIVVER